MYYRLVRILLAVLVLVVGAWTAAAAATGRSGEEDLAPIVASPSGGDSDLPLWLAWLCSVVLGEESSPGQAAETGSNAEDDSDRGPSMDPDG